MRGGNGPGGWGMESAPGCAAAASTLPAGVSSGAEGCRALTNPVSAPRASSARIEAHVLPTTENRVSIPSSYSHALAGHAEDEGGPWPSVGNAECSRGNEAFAGVGPGPKFNKAFGAC